MPGDALRAAPGGDGGAVALYVAGLAPSGRRSQAFALRVVGRLLAGVEDPAAVPWSELEASHVEALRAVLLERYAPSTAARYLGALIQVCARVVRSGRRDRAWLADLREVARVKIPRSAPGRLLSPAELFELFRAAGPREAAILALGVGAGLRVAELSELEVGAIDLAGGVVRVVAGKGGHSADVGIGPRVVAAVGAWLEVRGDAPGALFVALERDGRLAAGLRRLSSDGVRRALERLAARAGIVRSFTPHDMRRSFITSLLDRGDAVLASRAARHSSVSTTARYDRRVDEAAADLARSVAVPYRGPGPR